MTIVSEKECRLLTDDASDIVAIVEFGTPPTLDNLQRLLTVISEESKIYRLLEENCWSFATIIQDVLTEWCDGKLQGALSHQSFGEEARVRIRARKDDIMGLLDDA